MSTSHPNTNRTSTSYTMSTSATGSCMGSTASLLSQSTSSITPTTPTTGGGGGGGVGQVGIETNKTPIVLQASFKKFKTMKKKYFVLYRDSREGVARLEYYDSEKKFKARASQPKRKIFLKGANIARRLDTKYKYVIAFENKDDTFMIVLDSETDLNTWLRACIAVQRGEEITEEPAKPTFGKFNIYLFILFLLNNNNRFKLL